MQFGAGQELAAQCPRVPHPEGWRVWSEADGPVPTGLLQRAQTMVENQGLPLGATQSFPLPGVMALIMVEPRAWGRDAQGAFTPGCFRAAGIYLPAHPPRSNESTAKSSGDRLATAVNIFTVVSLGIGIVASLVTWGKKKR